MALNENEICAAAVAVELFALMVTALLLAAALMAQNRHDKKSRLFLAMLLVNAAALVCDMITWIWAAPQYTVLMYTANSFVFGLGYVMTALFTDYLGLFIEQKEQADIRIMQFVYGLSVLSVVLVFVSLFNGMYFYVEDGIFYAGDFGWLSVALTFVMILADMVLMFRHRNELGQRNTAAFLSYGVFPLAAFVIQMIGIELTVTWLASTLTMILIYLMVHVEYVRLLDRKRAELAESQEKLAESRTALMISQIQPHFLYNSLTAVDQLIRTDPPLARRALADFSTYLRCNLGSLKQNGLIPFADELRHVRAYLDLEQLRYGDCLHVVYDIHAEKFDVPSLSIQPLVENAVQHGLAKKNGGGTVTVWTGEQGDAYVIVIVDDGVGFAHGECRGDGAHIGLENIRVRLELMCSGTLLVQSEIGRGTRAMVTIPKPHPQKGKVS